MGRFVKGDVVVAPFPFSDLTAAKKRPALMIAALTGDDVLLCQITSKAVSDSYAIAITGADFESGLVWRLFACFLVVCCAGVLLTVW